METWILMADEQEACLVVRSLYGPCYRIETWKRRGEAAQIFAEQVAAAVYTLRSHYDALVVAAGPSLLEPLCSALPTQLVVHRVSRYLNHLSSRELSQELAVLIPTVG